MISYVPDAIDAYTSIVPKDGVGRWESELKLSAVGQGGLPVRVDIANLQLEGTELRTNVDLGLRDSGL